MVVVLDVCGVRGVVRCLDEKSCYFLLIGGTRIGEDGFAVFPIGQDSEVVGHWLRGHRG